MNGTSIQTVSQESSALFETVEAATPFDPRQLPTSGNASYEGNMVIFLSEDDAALGQMQFDVDLDANTFQGTADRFVDSSSVNYDGSLAITEGLIARDGDFNADYSATSLLNGTLTSPDRDIVVDGFIVGDFAGDNGELYKGFLRIGLNGETYQDGDPFGGLVAAQRN